MSFSLEETGTDQTNPTFWGLQNWFGGGALWYVSPPPQNRTIPSQNSRSYVWFPPRCLRIWTRKFMAKIVLLHGLAESNWVILTMFVLFHDVIPILHHFSFQKAPLAAILAKFPQHVKQKKRMVGGGILHAGWVAQSWDFQIPSKPWHILWRADAQGTLI